MVFSRKGEDGEMTAAESGRKLYRVVGVSFGLLCILQAALNISLRLALYNKTKTLIEEKDELKKNLTDCDNKTLDIEASIKTLIDEKDELKKKLTDFDNKKLDIEAFKTLIEEKDELKKNLTDFVQFFSQQGWKYFSGSFYYISSDKTKRKTWQDSRDDCLQRGMDLVVIDSREEKEFINQYQKWMWIGLTDREREGTWKWVDGTLMTTSFWLSGEPNNANKDENCAETGFYNEEKGWNDLNCREMRPWICEKKMSF